MTIDEFRGKASESDTQIALFEWAELKQSEYPELNLLHHIPNGGYRNKATAARLQREGVKSGVPDICLPVARRGYHGLYVELKTQRGKTSRHQNEWIDALRREGYSVDVARRFDEAIEIIEWYLGLKEV